MTRLRCYLANLTTSLMLGLTLVSGFSLAALAIVSTIVMAPHMTPLLLAVNALTGCAGLGCVWAFGRIYERATWYEPPKKRQVVKAIDGVPLSQYRIPRTSYR